MWTVDVTRISDSKRINLTTVCPSLCASNGYCEQPVSTTPKSNGVNYMYPCTYSSGIFDNPDTVSAFNDIFVTCGPSGPYEDCVTNFGTYTGMQNQISFETNVLQNYCTQTVYGIDLCGSFVIPFFQGLSTDNPACARLSAKREDSLCQSYANQITSSQFNATVKQSMDDYCNGILTNDCACISRTQSLIFNNIIEQASISSDDACWWIPCKNTGEYLVDIITKDCPTEICIQLTDVTINNSTVTNVYGPDIDINQYSSCNSGPNGGGSWYDKLWLVALIIFAGFLFLAAVTIVII